MAVAFSPAVGEVAGASPARAAATSHAAAKSPDAGCTLSRSLDYSSGEQGSCISVGAKLSRVPAVGQTAVLTVTVAAARAEADTRVTIDLPSTIAFADGTQTVAAVSGAGHVARADAAAMALTAGSRRTFTRVVKGLRAGFGEIAVRANNRVSSTRTDGGASSVFLTTSSAAGGSFLGRAASTGPGAVTAAHYTGAGSEAPAAAKVTRPPALARPATQVAARPGTAGTACASGNWYYVDQASVTRPAQNVVADVFNSANVLLGSAFTGPDGSYTVCWSTGGATTSAYVHFYESNIAWTLVRSDGTGSYDFSSGIASIPDGTTHAFGGLQPADSTVMRGLHAYQEANDEYQWMYGFEPYVGGCWSPFQTSCHQLVIHWQSDSTTGTFWNTTGAYLLAGSPDTLDEPVHEYGHALMYGLYGQTFPATTNCNPHFLFTASSTTCGFTEGWADWVATSIYNNLVWTFNGGSTASFDVTWNEGLGYDTGDQVEGRLVQAMRGLTDGIRAPWDNDPGEGSGVRDNTRFFTVLSTDRPNTFASFWSDRAALGQDTSQVALSALYDGTVDYGFRNPLGDYAGTHFPEAVPAHNYSFATTTGFWSVVAARPDSGSDTDLTLYNDFGHTSSLGSSSFGGATTDFVAINSNAGQRPLQTYYPVVNQFAGTGGYTIEAAQGTNTLSTGTTSAAMLATQPARVWDSFQSIGVPVFYRAVPTSGTQDLQLAGLLAGGSAIVTRAASLSGTDAGPGNAATLTYTPTATGFAGLVLLNNGMTAGTVNLYADTTAATGTVSIDGGAATTTNPTAALTLSATDAQTGVLAEQVSTDGVFDTEAVVPYSTSVSIALPGSKDGKKTVWVRYENNAGMWSAPVSDTIKLHAAPLITAIHPTSGPAAGGTTVTITGSFLNGATAVKFGTKAAKSFTVVSPTKITAVSPKGTAGKVDISVTTKYGTSAAVAADKFKYV